MSNRRGNDKGGTAKGFAVSDYKDGSTWTTPMTITTLQISVSDSYPNILFQNAHTVGTLTVSGTYCVCSFENLKITAMTYTITVGSLSVVQGSTFPINRVTVQTPHGTHCIAAASLSATATDTNCPTQTTRDAGITGTYIDTTTYCKSITYVCDDTAGACPVAGTAVAGGQGDFTITQDDGPVEFSIQGSSTGSSATYNPTFDTFAITSQILLTENKADFTTEPNDPRIYLYEVISPGYARMWAHSSLRQYIEARPWLLSMLSLSLLQPRYLRHTLIHIPDSQCPLRSASNIQRNTLISQRIESLSYIETSHLIAQKANGTYYEFEYTAKGDYIQTEIPFLGDNVFILACLIVSGVLAIYCVIAVFLILIRLKWQTERNLHKYLEKNRRFAIAKKEIQHKNDDTKKKVVTVKSKKRMIKILHMSIFTTQIKTMTIDLVEEDEEEVKLQQKSKKRISLSFFQAPTLYLEHLRRMRTNSFKFFLNSIYESPPHFPKWKLVSDNFFKSISVRLDLLQPRYLEYCTKEGLKPRAIDEEVAIIDEFNLRLEYKIDTSTDAYTHLRWKTPLERLDEAETKKIAGSSTGGPQVNGSEDNIILKFLASQCKKSGFKRDYILITELKERYDSFCQDNKIDDLVKINIVGCPELEEFGAKFDTNLYIPYISGISF